MNQVQFSVGRESHNDVVFDRPDVSRRHAILTLLEDGTLEVEDKQSTNGLFVNGKRVLKARANVHDQVKLSHNAILNLPELFKKAFNKRFPSQAPPKNVSTDYIQSFQELQPIWDHYQKERLRINKRYQVKSAVVRSALGLAPLAVWIVFKLVYLDQFKQSPDREARDLFQNWQGSFIYFSVIGGSLGNLLGGFLVEGPQRQLSILDEDFRNRYVCPCCKQQLGAVPWQSYKQQGKCFRCNAVYSNEHN